MVERKILFIITHLNFRDEEFTISKQILERLGTKIIVASVTMNECIGMFGLKVKPDIMVRDVDEKNFDALIIIGGSGSPKLADSLEVINLVKKFFYAGKLVASICLAGIVLARSGILKGRSATVHPADFAIAEFKRSGVLYEKKHVVKDFNIITADGPDATEKFVKEIVKILSLEN